MKQNMNWSKVTKKENKKCKNLVDEAIEKLHKIGQKRKQTVRENLDDETKQKLFKAAKKRKKTIYEILMTKSNRTYVNLITQNDS